MWLKPLIFSAKGALGGGRRFLLDKIYIYVIIILLIKKRQFAL